MASGLSFGTQDNCICVGQDSVVGIATHYGLDGTGIESRWEARFSELIETGPGVHPASGSFPAVMWPGRGVDHPPPSCAGVKKRKSTAILVLFLWPVVASSRVTVTFHNCIYVELHQCSASVDEIRTASLFL